MSAPTKRKAEETTKPCEHDGNLDRNDAGGLMCCECGQQIEDFWEGDEYNDWNAPEKEDDLD